MYFYFCTLKPSPTQRDARNALGRPATPCAQEGERPWYAANDGPGASTFT